MHRRLTIGVLVAVAVWVAALLVWAFVPATDHVPTGIVDGAQQPPVAIECARPISIDPGPTGSVPALPPPNVYARPPCIDQHRDNRLALAADLTIAVALFAVLGVRLARSHRTTEQPVAAV